MISPQFLAGNAGGGIILLTFSLFPSQECKLGPFLPFCYSDQRMVSECLKRNVSSRIDSSNEERIASCGSRSEIQHVPATLPASEEKCKKCATKCVARHSHWKDNLKFNSATLKKNTKGGQKYTALNSHFKDNLRFELKSVFCCSVTEKRVFCSVMCFVKRPETKYLQQFSAPPHSQVDLPPCSDLHSFNW